MIQSLSEIIDEEEISILERSNGHGTFFVKNKCLPARVLIDRVYERISNLTFSSGNPEIFNWDYDKLQRRFSEIGQLTKNHIIPDMEDDTVVFPVAYGCPFKCHFCEEYGKDFRMESQTNIDEKIQDIKELYQRYHDLRLLRQLFLLSTDVLLNKIRGGPDPVSVVDSLNKAFPYLLKRGAFVGVPSVNYFAKTDEAYMNSLFNPSRLNRVYIGPETFDPRYSRFLGIPFREEDKIAALTYLTRLDIKTKIIVLGGVGKAFIDEDGQIVNMRDCIVSTARQLELFLRLNIHGRQKVTVEFSVWQPVARTPLVDKANQGLIIPYDDPEQEIREEFNLLCGLLAEAPIDYGRDVRPNYEQALMSHPTRLVR